MAFETCSNDWTAPFRPVKQGVYFDWPLLTDIMPWQTSGTQAKRTWPIAPDIDTLNRRWHSLLQSDNRALAFKETRDRRIIKQVTRLDGHTKLPPISELEVNASIPDAMQYSYRSFDREYILADNRLGDYMRPSLWQTLSDSQIYLATLTNQALSKGPAVTVSAHIPDIHYFRGSYGAKDILPLYRDSEAKRPNLHFKLQSLLADKLSHTVGPEKIAAYLYGVLAHPGFTELFNEELGSRELRVPITQDSTLFTEAVEIGRELLYLHTYGERFTEGQQWPTARVKCQTGVPADTLPENHFYDDEKQVININGGEFGPVSRAVYDFEVSGFKVVHSWLDHRMQYPGGKKTSPLDKIRPKMWTSEMTSELLRLLNLLTRTLEIYPKQADLLERIVASPLIETDSLPKPPNEHRKAPKEYKGQSSFKM